ncbi:MAG: hypothetical protein IIV45_09030 [Lachnospiraceae bacterium]|nr:hypothetical protein [Lachnospiraceae bacterium]
MNEENNIRYAADKPNDCKSCFWWNPLGKSCKLGEKNCYYIIPANQPMKKNNPCVGCPYGKNGPCIGFCMKKLLRR